MAAAMCTVPVAAATKMATRAPSARVAFAPSLFKGQAMKAKAVRAVRREISTVCKAAVRRWGNMLEPLQ